MTGRISDQRILIGWREGAEQGVSGVGDPQSRAVSGWAAMGAGGAALAASTDPEAASPLPTFASDSVRLTIDDLDRIPIGLRHELRRHVPEDAVDQQLGHWNVPVGREAVGSNRRLLNLLTRSFSGTSYWSARETAVAMLSIGPEIVEPSFAIAGRSRHGSPSS